MRVFITGASGFVGSPVTRELLAHGHQVLGLARSDAAAQVVAGNGAEVRRGSLEDVEVLKQSAAEADAVIHLGFNHDFTKFEENCRVDKQAIEAIGDGLAGSKRPLIVTAGLGGRAAPGEVATEEGVPQANLPIPRVSEDTAWAQIAKGVSSAVVRLPQVHDTFRQGLITYLIAIARQKGVSAYVEDGERGSAAAHVSDVARLYRLALEKHEQGARYHAVAEESVRHRDIAEVIGRGLKVPVVSIPAEEAPAQFGWMGSLIANGIAATGVKTQQKLGWYPTGPGLLADLEKVDYSAV